MPVFYFDTDDGQTVQEDVYGIDLADRDAAYAVAVNTLPDLARSAMPAAVPCTVSVGVRDEDGQPVFDTALLLVVNWVRDRASPDQRRLPSATDTRHRRRSTQRRADAVSRNYPARRLRSPNP